MSDNNDNYELVPVHTYKSYEEGEIVREFLEANGIQSELENALPHSVLPVDDDTVVMVSPEDVEEAKRLLAERESMTDEAIEKEIEEETAN